MKFRPQSPKPDVVVVVNQLGFIFTIRGRIIIPAATGRREKEAQQQQWEAEEELEVVR